MFRIILILLCAFSFGNTLVAQRWFRQGATVTPLPVRQAEPRHMDVPRVEDYADFSPLSLQPDTVYAAAMVKRWGWMEPLHLISRAEARRRSVVYRFTNRNAAGHWQRLDCIDAYGRPKTGQFGTYLVHNGENDKYKDTHWNEKVQQTCGFDMVADASGREVLQERAYDAQGNLVYVFSRTKVAPRKYICAYTDGAGLPAEMRTNEGYSYGTLASLSETPAGYVARTSFLDAEGRHKPNYDEADCSHYIYDSMGQNTGYWSTRNDGTRVIDVCGNSGMMQEYDAWGNVVKITVMDDQWKPMTYATPQDPSNLLNGVIVLMRDYDKHGLVTRFWFTDAQGRRMTNASGLYERRILYNERGQETEVCDYDRNGRPINTLGEGMACYRLAYDGLGNMTDVCFLDSLLHPCTKKHYEFDSLGRQTRYALYKMENGEAVPSYIEQKSDTIDFYLFQDSTHRKDLYDGQGRKTLYAYLDDNYNLLENDEGYAFNTYEYEPVQDADGRIIGLKTTDTYYDKDSAEVFVDNYSKQVQYDDSLRQTTSIYRYAYGTPYEMYCLQFDGKFETRLGQRNIDAFGNVCRGAGVSSMCYYTAWLRTTPGGNVNAIIGRDEWGEPDYYYNKGGVVSCYNVMRQPSGDYYYDEDNHLITDFQALRNRLPKFMSVEVTDTTTAAFASGLRSNDLVLRYGYFEQPDTLMGDEDYKGNWAAKSCLSARLKKRVEVLRFHPETRTYSLYRMTLNEGAQKDLGVKFHCIYRTRRQMQHIRQALDSLSQCDTLDMPFYRQPIDEKVAKQESDSMVMLLPNTFTSNSFNQYSRRYGVPSIVLGAEMDVDGNILKWKHGDGLSGLQHLFTVYQDSAMVYPLTIWFTTDAYQVDSLSISTSIQETLVSTPVIAKDRVEHVESIYAMWRNPERIDNILCDADSALLDEMYDQGQFFYSKDCEDLAWTFFRALSKRHYGQAYSYITALLLQRDDADDILPEAKKWNRKAMRAGDYWGLLQLGYWYKYHGDDKSAIPYFEQLAGKSRAYRQLAYAMLDECYEQNQDSVGRMRNSLYWDKMSKDEDLLSDILGIALAYETREPKLVADVYANVAYILENVFDGMSDEAFTLFQKVRRLRGDLKCYDRDYSSMEVISLLHAVQSDSTYQKNMDHYLDDKLRVQHFTKDDAKARALGLQGDYYLLQLDHIEQTSLNALQEWMKAPVIRRPSIYLVKGSQVLRVDYDSELMNNSTFETLTSSRRASVIQQFHEWKERNPKEFDIE